MSDDVIDLGEYARRRDQETTDRTTFAVWGGEGERSRFALPLWRAVFLAGGNRGALVRRVPAGGPARPFVVLDLARDPARLEVPEHLLEDEEEAPSAPLLTEVAEAVVVFLGEHREWRWYLVVDGVTERQEPLERRVREDILFLAGECAGLLFFRDFAAAAEGPEGATDDPDTE
ncbi:MAG: hypothetical protein KY453_04990 [Gemmatimonadetes bacterium]|nr:hypothetical protein [Gemmatimonadota bacterium]